MPTDQPQTGDTMSAAAADTPRSTWLVIGGHSRAARAFRRKCSECGLSNVRLVVRKPGSLYPGEEQCVVAAYDHLPPAIFHGIFAALNFTGSTRAPTPGALWSLNVEGPIRAAAELKRQGGRRFVQISSLSVYGGAEEIDRSTPVMPRSEYGRSKLAADLGLAALEEADFTALLVRAPLIYGPGDAGKLSQLVALLKRTRWLPVPATLQPRSMVHVDNLAVGLIDLLRAGRSGVAFITDPEPFRLDRLAEVMARDGLRIRMTRPPAFLFSLLKAVAPNVFESLYAQSLVLPDFCEALSARNALSLEQGLLQVVRGESA